MNNPYVETRSGRKVYFLDPSVDSIDISDIAYALANQCRFNGHIPFYSVAEHSVYVSGLVAEELQLHALLHDAAEAYVGDMSSPLKSIVPQFRTIERRIQNVILKRFDIAGDGKEEIKQADLQQLRTEAQNFLPSKGKDWEIATDFDPGNGFSPRCLPPQLAYSLFMDTFKRLYTNEGTHDRGAKGFDSPHDGRIILP